MLPNIFSLTEEPVDDRTYVIDVVGELDVATHRQVTAAVERAVEGGRTHIVIDLRRTTFLDSSALSALLSCARRLRRPRGSLAVVAAPDAQPRTRFDLSGTGEVLNVCAGKDEALALAEQSFPSYRGGTAPASGPIRLRLYVCDGTVASQHAIAALEDLRRRHFRSGAEVEVINIQDHPEVAEHEGLLATPTLVRVAPPPVRRIVGDLTNHEQVLHALDLTS